MESERLSVEDINKLKVLDLKKKLQSRGLSINGNKSELKERLLKYYQSIDEAIDVTLDEAAGLIDDVDAADDLLNDSPTKLDGGGGSSGGVDTVAAVVNTVESAETKPQKIKLKRTLDDVNDDDDDDDDDDHNDDVDEEIVVATNVETGKNGSSNGLVSASNGLSSNAVTNAAAVATVPIVETRPHKVIKLADISKLTDAERMEMRIKKFGAISDEAKKLMRAKKFGMDTSSSSSSLPSPATTASTTASAPDLELLKKRAERFGEVCSPALLKLQEQEKLEERKKRFAANTPIPAAELNRKISLK